MMENRRYWMMPRNSSHWAWAANFAGRALENSKKIGTLQAKILRLESSLADEKK